MSLIPNIITRRLIKIWLEDDLGISSLRYNINTTTNEIDVDGDVVITDVKDESIPYKFGYVKGDLYIRGCELQTLRNSPNVVGGNFYCDNNILPTLKYAPTAIEGDFYCGQNTITRIETSTRIHVGNQFVLFNDGSREIDIEGIHNTIVAAHSVKIPGPNISRGGLGILLIKGISEITIDREQNLSRIFNRFIPLESVDSILQCQEQLIDAGYYKYAKV